MLFFLSLSAARGIAVDEYTDEAIGQMTKIAEGQAAITEVLLRPLAKYRGQPPQPASVAALHEEAHHRCFIANSVKTRINIEVIS